MKKYLMDISILLTVLQMIPLICAYEFTCPTQAHWNLRAKSMCKQTTNYTCLFDINFQINVYRDRCYRPRILGPGYKYVFQPNLNRATCRGSRYQPFNFETVGYSDCTFEKSLCNSLGQETYVNGDTTVDRKCICNTDRGYTFVRNLNNQCYCNPSTEDCSCYLEINPHNKTDGLKDIKCYQEIKLTRRPYSVDMLNISRTIKIKEFDNYKYNINHLPIDKYRIEAAKLVLMLSLAYGLICIVLLMNRRRLRRCIKIPSNLPEAINQLSNEDKARYNKLMQTSKTENRYFVRIMIVGKESVGKTCLLRRLLNEDISDVTSTDGVDIVVRRCKINVEDGKWTIGKDIKDDKVDRIKRALIPKAEDRKSQNMQVDETKNIIHHEEISADKNDITTEPNVNQDTSEVKNESSSFVVPVDITTNANISLDKNEETNESSCVTTKDYSTEVNVNTERDLSKNESSSLVMPGDLMSNIFTRSNVNTTSNLYALCELWDFAGQKEFYATHQAFLTSCAVYLVVADMEDDISKKGLSPCFADFQHIGEYVDFWFDSIHCHRTAEKQPSCGHIDPPIVLVFTGKDKYNEADFKKRERELNDQMDSICGFKSKYYHLHSTFYLSNTKDSDEEFEKLRCAIYETARKMDIWGKPFPLKWILLEHLIEINKNDGKNFLNFTDMSNLAKHPDIDIMEQKDLFVFLRFQHNVGNIIFFEDILDLIILRPQWLADAYRCLVSDRIGDTRVYNLEDWTLFKQQGKISESLITELFELKGGRRFSGQIINLNKVMEKLDILVKIENSKYYIMPSMMPSSTFDDVCKIFGILNEKCKRTSWLCFKFNFLPPSFFNHLSAWFIRKYDPSKIDSGFALYRGICMLDIDGSGCKKILVTMSTDTIALQIVSFSERVEKFDSTCRDIHSEVEQLIEDMKERYKVKISFKLHFKCSKGEYYKDTFEYDTLKTTEEHYCREHQTAHRSEQIYLPWMKTEVKKIPDDRAKISTRQDELISKNKPNKEEVQDQASAKNNFPVSVTLRQQVNIKKSKNDHLKISSCIKTGNTLVFTDYWNIRLIICNSDGTDIHHIPLSYRPSFITEIDSNTVAVACRYDSTILIINISTRSVTSTINTSGDCWGISYNDNNLYVVIDRSRIHVMDLTGKEIRTIPLPTDIIFDITVDRNRLVCRDTTSIYCCSLDGKILWKFEKDEFQDLTRVTTDNEGNVYVTNKRTHTVIVISDDGKHHKELLTKSDGLDDPWGIYFDKKENVLLVCNNMDGNAFLFDAIKKLT